MTTAVVIRATERSILALDAPTSADIDAAIAAAAGDATLVGPPRITRVANVGERFQTCVVAVFSFSSPPSDLQLSSLRARVGAHLRASQLLASWSAPQSSPFLPARNGDLAWWSSGQAAETRTRDAFPELAGRLDVADNPIGPTSSATHPTSAGEAAAAMVSSGGSVAAIVCVAVLLWFISGRSK